MMSELNCRLCSLRSRCIEQSDYASSIKIMMYSAFENRTDTLSTWKRLQRRCLLVEEEQPQVQASGSLNALSKRLRQAQTRKEKKQNKVTAPVAARTSGVIGAEELEPRKIARRIPQPQKAKNDTNSLKDVSQLERKHLTNFFRGPSADPLDTALTHWLTVEGSWRHISLPIDGSLVLGRCDPNVGMAPDIDLSLEDRQRHLISRRHLSIVAERGGHIIEDLGSQYGVLLNDEKLGLKPSRPLRNGDRITVGSVKLVYDRIPDLVLNAFNQDSVRHTLTVTATGQKYTLTPSGSLTIGRADEKLDYMPDIDLSNCGRIGQRVSRHHAQLVWQNGKPQIEDTGSGFGTRLHGALLPLGETKPLLPGDHIWLAGCVVAYDIEVAEAQDIARPQPGPRASRAEMLQPSA
jgi:pSer/pThr/pTyr-binding forkhead associated (FHA) protein